MLGTYIEAWTLDELWHKALKMVLNNGILYDIGAGSIDSGRQRRELMFFAAEVVHPETRPLAPTVPQHVAYAPTDNDTIESYYQCLMDTTPWQRADYHYGEFLGLQIMEAVHIFVKCYEATGSFGTNRVVMRLGDPGTIYTYRAEEHGHEMHTPCLTSVGLAIHKISGAWLLSPYCDFRSWDLWGGLPVNLGGIQLLTEDIAKQITARVITRVDTGPMFVASKGLHLYSGQWDLAKEVVGIE